MNHHEHDSARTTTAGLQAGGQPVPLLGVKVEAEVVAGHSRTIVRQRYRNVEQRPIEAIYVFPLPAKGAVTGFSMTVDGRRLEGEVHEREEAFQRYDDALTAGHGAALLEQERPNVFTANVGNLLPGEETVIEIEIVAPVQADEGATRWVLPTLVAPRYMGSPALGLERTGHGAAEPTPSVPDADRISPPIAESGPAYGLALDLVFDLGCEVDVESPSHAIGVATSTRDHRTRITFAQREVALDRDVVVTAFPRHASQAVAPIAAVVAHRDPRAATDRGAHVTGAFALSIVPDLGGLARRHASTDVVFVIDRSGSMDGPSITEAKTALRLCLRQLREGDRFAVIAFDDRIEEMRGSLTTFSRRTLEEADRWIDGVDARGGTEMLAPLLRATQLAPDGVIVLLTDGQVGNEDEILSTILRERRAARVYSFGIGTNVSDTLLLDLAEKTGGAVESIHPGERVDDKVVAQFARATAPRVTDVEVRFRGVDVGELAPAKPVALVDGEPFALFGTFEDAGRGVAEIRGRYDGETFYLEVPFDLPEREERAVVLKLWAQARIRDLERTQLEGRRADAMKRRIIELAKDHRVSSKYTSFLVVEKRTGARRTNEQAETRVVPVSPPAGWGMFDQQRPATQTRAGVVKRAMRFMAMPPSAAVSRVPSAPPPRSVAPAAPRAVTLGAPAPMGMASPRPAMGAVGGGGASDLSKAKKEAFDGARAELDDTFAELEAPAHGAAAAQDPVLGVLSRQSASGLWEQAGRDPVLVSVEALLVLVRAGVTTAHPIHGAQTKKAVDALLDALASAAPVDTSLVELALGVAWLLSTGRRTRMAIRDAAQKSVAASALAALFGRDDDVRAHVERIAPASH
ncbi:MAG: VWA domain-containing protein [Deltaproteobacteria bacterium]|nr:VWA domain-containing protein [Deltaproteobacteria bacterium]